eukprot:scaffold244333_cov33-Attheya_sp.AAC.1
MVTNLTSVNGITTDFPHPVLTKIHGEPTRKALVKMHKSLCENEAAVTSNLGGGNHGHLALLMTDTAYFEETHLAFIAPTNPGDDPPSALNPEEQPFVNDRYKRNQRIYEKYGNTDKALKKQTEATVEAAFISTIRHELTGLNQVTANMFQPQMGQIENSLPSTHHRRDLRKMAYNGLTNRLQGTQLE